MKIMKTIGGKESEVEGKSNFLHQKSIMEKPQISTLGELKASGYSYKSIKDELRHNLLQKIKKKEQPFPGIFGYEDTVIPELERAILSRHNINFLGLRGQAKTRLARMMVNLLDQWIPIVAGSEINDDPFQSPEPQRKHLVRREMTFPSAGSIEQSGSLKNWRPRM